MEIPDYQGPGVYGILNITNNHIYIGSTRNLYGRGVGHRTALNKGRHPNAWLQAAWSPKDFQFVVLELCTFTQLRVKEQFYIEKYGILVYNKKRAALRYEDVQDIRQVLKLGGTVKELADFYGVSINTIYGIAAGKTWKDQR